MTHLAGVVAVILAACCTSLSSSAEIQITWTRQDVQQYGPTTPLIVSLGDIIRINCDQSRSIHLLTDIIQYQNCSCDAIPESCADSQLIAGTCAPSLRATVTVAETMLPSVFNYVRGETYYFTSFASGTSGGPCFPTEDGQPGLRMAIMVDDPTATTAPEDTSVVPPTDNPAEETDAAMSTKTGTTADTTKTTDNTVSSSGLRSATVDRAAVVGGSVAGALVVISFGSVFPVVIFLILFLRNHKNKVYGMGMTERRPLQNGDVEADGDLKKDKLKDGNGEVQGKRQSRSNDYQDFKYMKSPPPANCVVQVENSDDDKVDLGSQDPHVFERSQGFAVSSGDFRFVERNRILSQNSSASEAIPEESEVEVSVREFSESTGKDGQSLPLSPAPPTKLISIDENNVMADNLSPTETPESSTELVKKQESVLSSITSFTTLAVRRIDAEKQEIPSKSDDDVFRADVDQSSNERNKPEKPQPVPRKMKTSTSSSSLNNILLDKENPISQFTTLPRERPPKASEIEDSFTTLPRGDKPKPKPRVARKSESETKKNHAYEDIDAVAAKPPKETVTSESESKQSHGYQDIGSIKPKPRVARKSESEGKVQAITTDQNADTSPTVKEETQDIDTSPTKTEETATTATTPDEPSDLQSQTANSKSTNEQPVSNTPSEQS